MTSSNKPIFMSRNAVKGTGEKAQRIRNIVLGSLEELMDRHLGRLANTLMETVSSE